VRSLLLQAVSRAVLTERPKTDYYVSPGDSKLAISSIEPHLSACLETGSSDALSSLLGRLLQIESKATLHIRVNQYLYPVVSSLDILCKAFALPLKKGPASQFVASVANMLLSSLAEKKTGYYYQTDIKRDIESADQLYYLVLNCGGAEYVKQS
jgi:hypothetical protein